MSEARNQTRAALLEAAADLFARQGYRQTSHADIAAAAYTGRTTFYEYFDSMEDLLVQLVEAWLPPWVERTLEEVPDDLAPDVRLAEICSRMISFVASDNLGLILHDDVRCLAPEMQRRIGVAHRALSAALVDTYHAGTADGSFRPMPLDLAMALVDSTIMTAARTLMATGDAKAHVHEVSDAAVDFLLAGLRP